MLKVDAERDQVTVVAKTEGRIDSGSAQEFQAALEKVIQPDDKALIIDFENVSYISSAGMRVILLTAKTLQRQGGQLALCALTDPIREVFKISGFDNIIAIHQTRAEAAAAISK